MDIQRGDQVRYRDELWVVKTVRSAGKGPAVLVLRGPVTATYKITVPALSVKVQRVEQVR